MNFAAGGSVECSEQMQQRTLTAAAFAYDRAELTLVHVKADTFQDRHLQLAFGVILEDIVGAEDCACI